MHIFLKGLYPSENGCKANDLGSDLLKSLQVTWKFKLPSSQVQLPDELPGQVTAKPPRGDNRV